MRQTGLTMIELMIVILIGAIVVTFGVPSFQLLIQNNNIVATTNSLKSSLQLARTEAVSRGSVVNVSRTGSTSNDWTDGWQVYVTPNTAVGGSAFNSGTDELLFLKDEGAAGAVNVMANNAANQFVSFNPDGSLNEASAVIIAVCDDRGTDAGREITIAMTGRVSLVNSTASCAP